VEGRDDETLALAPRFASRPSVFVGRLARMVQSGRERLIRFVIDAADGDPSLATRPFAGTTLLHFAAGAGCLEVLALLTAAWCGPEHPGSRRPYAAVLRRERMRVGDGPRGSPYAGASRRGRQRV
jgi:hypothetical protein